ncbi:MAG: tetratricopeptide repeat protein [Deltaproteobacteria bacterium]|nr:tetratricopeptide repeat protein [Deltaproteobacteria bacterium]
MRNHKLVTVAALAIAFATAGRTAWAQPEDDLREGDRHFEGQDWRKAAAAYDSAIRKYPAQVPPEAYGKRAAIFIILQDWNGGITFLHNVAEKQYPNAPEILEQEALILWQQGKKPDAVAVAEKVVKAKPSSFTNQNIVGEFYSGRDAAKTANAYEAYLANRPAEIEDKDVLPRIRLGFAYLTLARDALGTGSGKESATAYDKAASQFETVEKKFSKKPHATTNAQNGLCAAYTGQGHFDRAITVCEKIITDPRKIDANGSVWFNLGTAYLANKQPKRARTAANEYIRLRKNEARGHLLIGDSYFEERDWSEALKAYLEAEKLLKPSQQREQVELSIQLGKVYRRLPFSGSGANPNVAKAIEKLSAGYQANPGSLELAAELGGAYLESKDDANALKTAERGLNAKGFATAPEDQRTSMLLIAAKAQYNQGKLKDARARFEQAFQIRPKDVQVRRGLVEIINAQAWTAFDKDPKSAEQLLGQALEVDGGAPMTSLNLAVVAIDRGDCDSAGRYLEKIKNAKGYALTYQRLTARTFLCSKSRDPKKAAEHYAAADAEVKKVQANLIQAEIYTEWAPLLWDTDLEGAVDRLQTAVQFAAQEPSIAAAAKRNLAVALYKRGWKLMRDGKATDAAADFERASREPALLKGSEPLAFEFSHALALLDRGDTTEAARKFKELATKGNQASYLKPAYAKLGAQFFGAYANYRSPNAAARQQAANDFQGMVNGAQGAFANKVKDLTASAWEMIAVDAIRSGRSAIAQKALSNALKYADGEMKKRVVLDRLVVSPGKDDVAVLEAMGGSPPEALVNLGIAYDQLGRAKDAYEAWTKARAKGAGGRDLQKWIDSKKRIYGF